MSPLVVAERAFRQRREPSDDLADRSTCHLSLLESVKHLGGVYATVLTNAHREESPAPTCGPPVKV